MQKKVVAKAPGKLILSGEYAVLYKMPAIVITVDAFTTASASIISENSVIIELKDYDLITNLSLSTLNRRYLSVQSKYDKFLSRILPINKVVQCPTDLCCFLLGYIFDKFKIETGLKLSIKSNIPIGVGFGSSAAFIVSVLKSLNSLFDIDLTQEEFYEIALKAEHLIHGDSSGIDLLASMKGGCNYFCDDVVAIDRCNFEFFSIFTGKPQASTGESVLRVKDLLGKSDKLQLFKNIALRLKNALQKRNLQDTITEIRNNHFLLKELGVVPKRVQNFIKELELNDCAAKTCGSGAIVGDSAGIVVSVGRFSCINKIAKNFGYHVDKIRQSNIGAYALQN